MFNTSAKINYALHALLEITERHGSGLVQINDIIKNHAMPKNYLEQILNKLTKSGLIRGIRGSNGGYALGRDPQTISLYQIMEAIDGELGLEQISDIDAVRETLHELERSIRTTLSISLEQLLKRRHAKNGTLDYQI